MIRRSKRKHAGCGVHGEPHDAIGQPERGDRDASRERQPQIEETDRAEQQGEPMK
jgi:hypothetical protein